MKLYSTLNTPIDKIMMDTNNYVQNYIDHNLRNVYENVDSTQYPNNNDFFYKDIQLAYNLDTVNKIYPLSVSPLYKIYCPVLFYDRDFITAPPIQPDRHKLIAISFKTSALVQNTTTITLQSKNTTSESYSFIITRYPKYGTITQVSNSIITYIPNINTQDSFQYVVKEESNISAPGTVIIYNYSQEDVASISRNQGTFIFDDITFDGDIWQFGTFTTDTFIQNGNYSRMGNFEFYN